MVEMHVTLHCAKADTEAVVFALRKVTRSPVHVRREEVFGRDFDDAHIGEKVRGSLARAAVSLIVENGDLGRIIAAVTDSRRALPVRWQASPVTERGRIE